MSVGDGASAVPAGWYPDPADKSRLRRWDGQQWTQDVILAPQQDPVGFVPPRSEPTPTETLAPPAPFSDDRPDPPSDPASLPDWANLPGLTLPPDLSGIPGMTSDSILPPPTFAEPSEDASSQGWAQPPILTKPTFVPDPEAQPAPSPHRVASAPPNLPPPAPPRRVGQPVTPGRDSYAPPPAGAQYDVPPPPGAVHAAGPGLALPASSLVAPRMPSAAWSSMPQIDLGGQPPIDFEALPRTSASPDQLGSSNEGVSTWAWLIAALPLLQFIIIYLIFAQVRVQFAPGVQWGILAAPAALSLILAIVDRRKLSDLGADRPPSPLLAIIPPIYLLVRVIDVGRASIVPLVSWFVLQIGAAAGVYFLLPTLLSAAIHSFG